MTNASRQNKYDGVTALESVYHIEDDDFENTFRKYIDFFKTHFA